MDRTTQILLLLALFVLALMCVVALAGLYTASRLSSPKPLQPLAVQDTPANPVAGSAAPATPTPFQALPPTPTLSAPPTPLPTTVPTSAGGLRVFADRSGLLLGAAIVPSELENPQYARLLANEFNALVPEVDLMFDRVHPEPERYDFSGADAAIDFARRNNMKVRAMTLAWGNALPDWVKQGNFSREQWIEILRQHIYTVAGRYKASPAERVVVAWDVVNEAVANEGGLFNNFWLQVIGPEYIPLAFQFAHEADPGALLFYNDNEGEGLNVKSDSIYLLVKELKESGVPIDGVGLQMHTTLEKAPTTDELVANMQRLADLGLLIHITEMDVRTQYSDLPLEQKLSAQAEVYQRVLDACRQVANCQAFFTWGLTDRYSWIPGYTGSPDIPLLFDENFQPKAAYYALRAALQK